MPDPNAPTPEPQANEGEDLEAKINAIVNRAITGHMKRAMGGIEKSIADTVAKSLASVKPDTTQQEGDGKPREGSHAGDNDSKQRPDPQQKLLAEKLETLQRQLEEERTARRDTEQKARRDTAHSSLRAALQEAGIRPELLKAAHTMLGAESLRLDEEGNARFIVKRVREKGRPAEDLEFDDLSQGVKDWLKSDEAKAFIPAPSPNGRGPGGSPLTGPPGTRKAPTYTSPPSSDAESARRMAEQLTAQGVDLNNIFND